MSNIWIILIGIIAIIMLCNSFYIHYIVKDGVARKILLWFNAIFIVFFILRTIGYILLTMGVLNIYTSKTYNQDIFTLLYIIPLGQQWLQRNHRERNESDRMESDKLELKARRKRG
jgi:hypothetical protein